MRPDLHGRRAGEREPRIKGTWGSPTEAPSRGTKSQPTGNNKKCFYHYKMNLKKHQPPCFSQTKVVTSVQLMVHYDPKGYFFSDLREPELLKAETLRLCIWS